MVMQSLFLQGIDADGLRKIIGEVLEEKLNQVKKSEKQSIIPNYLNRFDVAKLLKISLPTLNNWSKSGLIQSYRIGTRILYKLEEIEQAIHPVKNQKYKRG